MNLWQKFELNDDNKISNKGISFHYQQGIDEDLKRKYISFARWLRKNYCFPTHLNIYILNLVKVQLMNGKEAYGSFRWSENREKCSICIPSAIESELLNEYTKEDIYEQILSSLVHEITHYFQWVLKSEQSNATSERQANYFRYRIIEKYNGIG